MDSNFTMKTDQLRLLYTIFSLLGAIFSFIVAIRILQQDEPSQSDNKYGMKQQIQNLEKQLQKLKAAI